MLWWSDASSNEDRPAILLMAATFATPTTLLAEAVYYDTPVPPGPTPGWYLASRRSEPERVTLNWPSPADLPCDGLRTLHPADGWTPGSIVVTDEHGTDRVRLEVIP